MTASDSLARVEADARCSWCGGRAHPWSSRLARCPSCGAWTTFPPPDERELEAVYAGAYRPPRGRFTAGGDAILRRSRATLARRVDRIAPPGPVLDVGCGDGALLDALGRRGREAVGLERAATRDDVRARDVTDFDERPHGWSAVVFWHSLEHLRAPGAALDRARDLLAPGGVLVVAVPNTASWQARAFGARWLALDLPRHLVHLPASALLSGVRARGLAVERISYWRGGQVMFGWLHGLVGAIRPRWDLYDAIRRPEARFIGLSTGERAATLIAGLALSPLAATLSVLEIAAGSGGTVYVEARLR